jgi:N-acetyl sugar amidotransferase
MSSTSFKTCKRCLYSTNHPLGLVIDEEGICSGCRVHEEKDQLDWAERWDRLEQLVKPYRSRDSRTYDCIVPVSGAGDSFFIVHLVKERLKLKPLLVTYNRYYNTPLGIRNLAQLRRRFDCNILIQNVNPLSVKKIIRTTLRKLKSFHWPVLAGQSVFPVQTAVSHQIPLIIWGAHQGVEQVGMFSHLHEVEMTRRYRKEHDLMGYEADDLISTFDVLNEGDIFQYRYPEERSLESVGVRGIYLGNYVRWDPLNQHRIMVRLASYGSSKTNRTFDVFDHVDDWHYMDSHDCIKYTKHRISRVTDQACREIRHLRLTREKALSLVEYYQTFAPSYQSLLSQWLGLDPSGIHLLTSMISDLASPASPFSSIRKLSDTDLPNISDISENPGFTLETNIGVKHIIHGKGFP